MSDSANMVKGSTESSEKLIMDISQKVAGIGKSTAGFLAVEFDNDIHKFLAATVADFSQMKKSNGKNLLSEQMVNELVKETNTLPQDLPLEEIWVFYLGREFLINQVNSVNSISFNDLDINPLLAIALNLDTPEEVITFNLYQTITRSIVTSWGDTVEKMVEFVGCKKNDYIIEGKTGKQFDLMKEKDSVKYYIQIKSGPNTMNVGMVESLNDIIEELESTKADSKGLLGMTYGTRDRISNQIMGNLRGGTEKMLVGRELWDFVSDQENYHTRLFEVLDISSRDVLNQSFSELVNNKIGEFVTHWKQIHGDTSVRDILDNYL